MKNNLLTSILFVVAIIAYRQLKGQDKQDIINNRKFLKFGKLSKDMKSEVFKHILLSLVKDCLTDPDAQEAHKNEKLKLFFKSSGDPALVNKEFKEFLRSYMPLDFPNRFCLCDGESLLNIAIENNWPKLADLILDYCKSSSGAPI